MSKMIKTCWSWLLVTLLAFTGASAWADPIEILVCKTGERTESGGVYTYVDASSAEKTFTKWAGSISDALTLAGGEECSLYVGGTGVATGDQENPSQKIVVNATANNNVKQVTVDQNAVLFVGNANERNVVDISRFQGTGTVAAYGMVAIDKSQITFGGTLIGCVSTVTAPCSFVSSIEGASAANNLNNNGATVYSFGKNLRGFGYKCGSEFVRWKVLPGISRVMVCTSVC